MEILVLATQVYEKEDDIVLWTLDLNTKILIKAHIANRFLSNISVGDVLVVQIAKDVKRQEVWLTEVSNKATIDELELLGYLESKSATPFSVHKASFIGNIVKIEEVLEVNKNTIKAKLVGFPREIQYVDIHDTKWKYYWDYNSYTMQDFNMVRDAMNKYKNKYFIIDFPKVNQLGNIQGAAIIVR